MSNWSKALDRREERQKDRKDKMKLSRETLGKYFFDLSKLTFTALILGGGVSLLSNYTIPLYWEMMVVGIISSVGLARIGLYVLNK